jgi:O-antigen/teichoic acid export membrane protein
VQPVLLCVTTIINLVLTIILAGPLGALGPAVASLAAALIHLPLIALLARRRLRDGASPDDDQVEASSVVPVTAPQQDARNV